jgi:hypothetical protein
VRLFPSLSIGKRLKIILYKGSGTRHIFLWVTGMDLEETQRLVRNFRGGAWPWIKTRPKNHWIWRFALSLGEDHLVALPQIISEMSGWRGFPSRGVLKLAELREELIEHWELYRGKPVREAVKILGTKVGLRITPKCLYGYMKKFGLKRDGNVRDSIQ